MSGAPKPAPPATDPAEARRAARIAEAEAELAPAKATAKEAAPVYDERGNVRPHGTKGAKPMTYAERVAIAEKLAKG